VSRDRVDAMAFLGNSGGAKAWTGYEANEKLLSILEQAEQNRPGLGLGQTTITLERPG